MWGVPGKGRCAFLREILRRAPLRFNALNAGCGRRRSHAVPSLSFCFGLAHSAILVRCCEFGSPGTMCGICRQRQQNHKKSPEHDETRREMVKCQGNGGHEGAARKRDLKDVDRKVPGAGMPRLRNTHDLPHRYWKQLEAKLAVPMPIAAKPPIQAVRTAAICGVEHALYVLAIKLVNAWVFMNYSNLL